jgi:SAM-dependent methyltransferase
MKSNYVHGYTEVESARLNDQANTLSSLLHHDSFFPEGSKVLEAGCGVGSQTVILCTKNPGIRLTSADISSRSIETAKKRCMDKGIVNVEFIKADLFDLPFEKESFDHVFLCFVLEHLSEPEEALRKLQFVLKRGGTVTAIEGDHGSAYYYPRSPYAQKTIDCLIRLQADKGGDSLIGRSLYPLLYKAGFIDIRVSPRVVYADVSLPGMVDGFTKKTFIAMVEGVKEDALKENMIDEEAWKRGIKELKETSGKYGTFNYTFFKAVGIRP